MHSHAPCLRPDARALPALMRQLDDLARKYPDLRMRTGLGIRDLFQHQRYLIAAHLELEPPRDCNLSGSADSSDRVQPNTARVSSRLEFQDVLTGSIEGSPI
jgi:hypothetical protein